MMTWSPKQGRLVKLPLQNGHTWMVHGPVRSGKSLAACYGFGAFASKMFAGHDFIVASRSQRQLSAVILNYLRQFARDYGMTFRTKEDHYEINSWQNGPPNKFYPLIGSDISSQDKASGLTVAGAILDEAHVMPETFVNVVRERVISVPGSKIVLIANPQGPRHYLKTDIIDEALNDDTIIDMGFELADNETLTQQQIDLLYKIYPPGPLRERRIFGKWVSMEGIVYPFYQEAIAPTPKDEQPWRRSISIDHARSGVTHALRFDWYQSGIWAAGEWEMGRTGPRRVRGFATSI